MKCAMWNVHFKVARVAICCWLVTFITEFIVFSLVLESLEKIVTVGYRTVVWYLLYKYCKSEKKTLLKVRRLWEFFIVSSKNVLTHVLGIRKNCNMHLLAWKWVKQGNVVQLFYRRKMCYPWHRLRYLFVSNKEAKTTKACGKWMRAAALSPR